MNALRETEKLLAKMTRAEKAQVLQWVVRDLGDAFPGIESIPGVSGGALHRTYAHSSLGVGTGQAVRNQYGEQIVPEKWMQASTTGHIETKGLMNAAEDDGYGYYWWVDSFGGYSAHGHGGQYVFVLPKLDMIVVFTGSFADLDFPTPHRLLKVYLLPAAQSAQPLADNPQIFNQLMAEIVSIQDTERPVAPLPKIVRHISGKTYRITGDASASWPEKITFAFPGEHTYTLEMTGPDGTEVFTGGLNNTFYLSKLGPQGERIIAFRGYWQDDHTFVEEQNFDLTSDIQFFTVTYTFEGKKVSIKVDSSMGYFSSLQATGVIIE